MKFSRQVISSTTKSVSNETARTIDSEIRKIIDTQYSRATKLIKDNMDKMHLMADALMKYETIDTSQIDEIMEGKVHQLQRVGQMMMTALTLAVELR